MLDFLDILEKQGFDRSLTTKLVRHKDSRHDLYKLFTHDQLPWYQQVQTSEVFGNCQQIISFVGIEQSKALFVGVYDVKECQPCPDFEWPSGYLYPDMPLGSYRYSLVEQDWCVDLRGRMIIEWGSGTRSWVQKLKSKEVVEIRPKGYVTNFPGYLDFVLDYHELHQIIQHSDAHRDWHQHLAASAGIYLIADTKTGQQYIGSAYGREGILGRWKQYADSGHGGNRQLQDLIETDSRYMTHFTFTILRTLSKTLTDSEVIAYESLYKEKLGTRTFGLNSN